MFDIATRPASIVPFDWRMLAPLPATAYPWTDFMSPSGQPSSFVSVLKTYAVELEPTLQTALILSLFTDRRAGPDDRLPQGVVDRRGWVGDEFVSPDDAWGSLLWLLWYGKGASDMEDIPGKAEFAVQEALAWMVNTKVASQVVATAEWVAVANGEDRLAIRVQIYQASRTAPVYDVLWGTTIQRGAS